MLSVLTRFGLSLRRLGAVAGLGAFLFCCGAERDAPRPKTGTAPVRRAPLVVQHVRVLLKENFDSALIEDSSYGLKSAVRGVGGNIQILNSSGRELASGSGFRLDPSPGRLIHLDGVAYRGSLEAFVNPLGSPVLVNELALEDYLKGVVANEMSPRLFPVPEALKAQSVAARTYAASSIGRLAQFGFDLFSDVRSQVYGGVPSEQLGSTLAVEQTRGLIAVYQGKPIVAFYSSTCGGQTAGYKDMFNGPEIPYLKGGVSCSDETSRYHTWRERLRPAQFQAYLRGYAAVGRLKDLKIQRTDSAGRVLEMRFAGDMGQAVLSGSDLRFALGLRSNLITRLKVKKDRLGFVSEIEVAGRGFGHGVGMCQIGAVELGKKGLEFRRILKRYYPGVEVVRAY